MARMCFEEPWLHRQEVANGLRGSQAWLSRAKLRLQNTKGRELGDGKLQERRRIY